MPGVSERRINVNEIVPGANEKQMNVNVTGFRVVTIGQNVTEIGVGVNEIVVIAIENVLSYTKNTIQIILLHNLVKFDQRKSYFYPKF